MTTTPVTTTPIAPPVTPASPPLRLSFEDYCAYVPPDDQRYELVHGILTPMATPTGLHTAIIRYLVYCLQRVLAERALSQANAPKLVIVSDLGVRTTVDSSRLPDITVCSQALWSEVVDRPGSGVLDFEATPLLVVEVVSQDWRVDYESKRLEYAAIGIPVYVLVDAKRLRIRVHHRLLAGNDYEMIDFSPGEKVIIPGFPELPLPVEEVLNPPIVEILQEQDLRDRAAALERERDRAEAAEQQAQAERQRAETAEQQAQAERQRAESAEQQAQADLQRAEIAEQQAQADRQRVDRLLGLLRAQGIDPDQ